MTRSTEKYLTERCRKLEAQVEQQEVTIQLLAMQRDELQVDIEEAEATEETLVKVLKLIAPGIYTSNDDENNDDENDKLRHISLSVWERYSPEDFKFLEELLKEHNMIEVAEWEEVNA